MLGSEEWERTSPNGVEPIPRYGRRIPRHRFDAETTFRNEENVGTDLSPFFTPQHFYWVTGAPSPPPIHPPHRLFGCQTVAGHPPPLSRKGETGIQGRLRIVDGQGRQFSFPYFINGEWGTSFLDRIYQLLSPAKFEMND